MSGDVSGVMGDLVAEFAAVGIPSTMDPDLVLPILSDKGFCALVGPPTVERVGLGTRLDLDIPVHIACNPPGALADWLPVFDALPDALMICAGQGRPVALTLATATVPAYQLRAMQSITVSAG